MPLPRGLPTVLPFPIGAPWVTTATITQAGLTLLASALINSGVDASISYVAIGTGAATLSSGLSSGVPIISLPVNALPAAIAAGQSLTIIYSTYTDTVTVTNAGAAVGATSIPINSWTPAFSYPSGSGLVNTPAVTDTALQAEVTRAEVSAGTVGANPGETLVSGYFDPTTATGTYLEVGYYGGVNASLTPGSGILVARDLMWWQHTVNVDSYTNQLDSTV